MKEPTFTSFWVVLAQVPVAWLADVTFGTVGVLFAVTLTRHQAALSVVPIVADALAQRSDRRTVARLADAWIVDWQSGVAVEKFGTFLAVLAGGVVLTVVTNTARNAAAQIENRAIERTAGRVIVALTALAGVHLTSDGRLPFQVVVQVQAAVAVVAGGEVAAIAFSVDHAGHRALAGLRNAARRVTVTAATATNHHVVDGVIVLLLDLLSRVEKIVTQRVQLRESDTQIGHLEQLLNLIAVRVVDVNVRRQHFKKGERSDGCVEIVKLERFNFWIYSFRIEI